MLIKIIIEIYLLHVVAVILHELFHMIAGLICLQKVELVVIGCEKISINVGRFRISPLILGGRVDVDSEILERSTRIKKVCFFISGVLANLLLALLTFVYAKIMGTSVISIFYIAYNIVCIVVNMLPFENNDMGVLLQILR